jgi:hypothetical protein
MVRSIEDMRGIQPELRGYLASIESALAGDIVMVIDPETVAPVPTTSAWTRNVKISIENAAGAVHGWLNKAYTTTASIGDTGGGTASIVSTTLTIVDGQAVIVVSGTEATWAHAETDTLTIANITVLGVTVTGGTSVETFTT